MYNRKGNQRKSYSKLRRKLSQPSCLKKFAKTNRDDR